MLPKKIFTYCIPFVILSILCTSFIYTSTNTTNQSTALILPYKKAGLTNRQAAAHLLNKFTFGPTPTAIDNVVNMGVENWLLAQLDGKINDDALQQKLSKYDALNMTNSEVLTHFPRMPKVVKEAIEAGVIDKSMVKNGNADSSVNTDNNDAYKQTLQIFMDSKGYRPQKELFRQFISKKIISAAYSNNQLHQMLTEFWFNHFNVSLTKNQCAAYIPAYERDVIRPNVTGKFEQLLISTAQSPAMLFYLDNFNSIGENDAFAKNKERLQKVLNKKAATAMEEDPNSNKAKLTEKLAANKKMQGLNENYAREVMELHTLGVDGGYTQTDVTEAAKVLTGWTIYPMAEDGPSKGIQKIIDRVGIENLQAKGFVHHQDFLFAINRHDTKEKIVLGKKFAAGGGYQEGVDLLHLLATHTSTAQFICKKLATKFVQDNPPATLINKMAATFLATEGDIKQVLITMASADEFWNKNALTEKTKSPFELAISAVRATNATIEAPFKLYQWITKMGQKLYAYQAPTGYPDKAAFWINTGSLLNRMNFGLAFANEKIPGIQVNLAALNNYHEPESANAALHIYTQLMLPEQDVTATIKRLTPLINDPSFQQKIMDASKAATNKTISNTSSIELEEANENSMPVENTSKNITQKKQQLSNTAMDNKAENNSMLAQVVGIIIGSPAFQKR